jgi:hypothetical protein
MAGIRDYETMRTVRRAFIGAVLLVVGLGLGYTWPRHTAWPNSETGTVLSVSAGPHGAPVTFVFRPGNRKVQRFVLASPTPWRSAPPTATWHATGRPDCVTPGSPETAKATIGVIDVRSASGAPGASVVVWIECG